MILLGSVLRWIHWLGETLPAGLGGGGLLKFVKVTYLKVSTPVLGKLRVAAHACRKFAAVTKMQLNEVSR